MHVSVFVLDKANGSCHVFSAPVGEAHKCKCCGKFIHIFCGTPEGEEGFGQQVTCKICQKDGTKKCHKKWKYICFNLRQTE
jgi:hypothetical protein